MPNQTANQQLPQANQPKADELKVIKTEQKVISGFVATAVDAAGYNPLRLIRKVTCSGGEEVKFENRSMLPDDMVGKACTIQYNQNTLENSVVRNIVIYVNCQ